jgi:hypothetical protein
LRKNGDLLTSYCVFDLFSGGKGDKGEPGQKGQRGLIGFIGYKGEPGQLQPQKLVQLAFISTVKRLY